MTRYYGDFPAEHIELIQELKLLEDWFDKHGGGLPPISIAKGMVCIAHDYYNPLEMDEEGDRFLILAEKYYPGYFKDHIQAHMKNDEQYCILVHQLESTLGSDIMEAFGYNEK